MLFVPSPDVLIHSKSKHQRHLLIFQQESESKCFVLQGLTAKEIGDLESAIVFLREPAASGNVAAMIELGCLYERNCDLKQALQWFYRALRKESVNALQHLGNIYRREKDYERALFFYYEHFEKTRSSNTAFVIGQILEMVVKNRGIKWLKFSAALGFKSSVYELVKTGNTFWEKVVERKRQTNYHSLLSLKHVKDTSLPSLERALSRLKDPFACKEGKVYENENQQVSFVHISKGIMEGKVSTKIGLWWPSNSETNKFLLILEMASEDEEKRNLKLCEGYLKNYRRSNPLFPFNLHLWRRKLMSEDTKDLIGCGFVSCLLGDYKYALTLFQRASIKGSEVGALMCGLIFYYGFGTEKDIDLGVFCMSRCHLNPIALMHLWVAVDEKNSWCHRAKYILSGGKDYPEIYEWVGDYFSDGLKFPRQTKIALSWYYIQLIKSEKHGLDTNKVVEKISRLVYERAMET